MARRLSCRRKFPSLRPCPLAPHQNIVTNRTTNALWAYNATHSRNYYRVTQACETADKVRATWVLPPHVCSRPLLCPTMHCMLPCCPPQIAPQIVDQDCYLTIDTRLEKYVNTVSA